MSRLIIYIVIFAVICWLVRTALAPPKRRIPKADEKGEELIQDPVCQCYIPRSQAYTVTLEGRKHFFCSEGCYKKYLRSHSLPKP